MGYEMCIQILCSAALPLTASPAIDIVPPEVSLTGVLLLAIVFVLRTEIPPR
jgi:hypothetical protein